MRGLLACLLLAGCATAPQTATISAEPVTQTVAKTICPPIISYTQVQESALAAAIKMLPADSPLVGAMVDYGQLRATIRACTAS